MNTDDKKVVKEDTSKIGNLDTTQNPITPPNIIYGLLIDDFHGPEHGGGGGYDEREDREGK